ncbi:MAG: response regulator [Desulfobulbaceae bacterium]|nr:response regulator [Desulfobulbaceae bacterium]
MTKKILVVDNNKVILRVFKDHLSKKGYEVATAEDGLAALEVLEDFRPAVIFVDLVMPRIGGEKLCRIIRGMPEFDHVALVVVSAIAVEKRPDFSSLGVIAWIAKGPVAEMKSLIDAVLLHLEDDHPLPLPQIVYGGEDKAGRQVSRELIAASKHFEVTLDNMVDGFLELTMDGVVVFANRAASLLLDTPEEKLLAASLADCFSAEGRRQLTALIAQLDDEAVELGEAEPLLVKGRFLVLKLVPFRDQGRRCVIALIHDITASKAAALELLQHRNRLEEEVAERTAALVEKNAELERALAKVKMLSGLLPICAACKKIRDDRGYWSQIEVYIGKHSEAEFSHSLCPDCATRLYPKIFSKENGSPAAGDGGEKP